MKLHRYPCLFLYFNVLSFCVYNIILTPALVGAKAWTCVNEFFDFMTSKGYASAPPDGAKYSRLGDVLQLYNENKKTYSHAVIATKSDDVGIYYSAHSKNRKDYPVWYIFDGTYTWLRLINLIIKISFSIFF